MAFPSSFSTSWLCAAVVVALVTLRPPGSIASTEVWREGRGGGGLADNQWRAMAKFSAHRISVNTTCRIARRKFIDYLIERIQGTCMCVSLCMSGTKSRNGFEDLELTGRRTVIKHCQSAIQPMFSFALRICLLPMPMHAAAHN